MIVLSGFVGALLGISLTLVFNLWKFNRDERVARVDELCALMSATAALACDYWSKLYQIEGEQRIQEARILGSQALIDGHYADIRSMLKKEDSQLLDDLLADLFSQISGGEFSVRGRGPDVARVLSSPQAASAVILALRRAHRRTIPLAGLIAQYHENREQKLDLPLGWPVD